MMLSDNYSDNYHENGFIIEAHYYSFQTTPDSFSHFLSKRALGTSTTQPAFTCSNLTIETLEQGVKYI